MSGNTIRLHRVLRGSPDRVYRAFIDPDALVKWIPPHGFSGHIDAMDAREGGGYHMSFTNFTTGTKHSFGVRFLELKPGELIRHTDQFDDPNLPGEMQVTIQLKPVLCGTELTIVQEGVPEAIPVEFCYQGWQESLHLLALLVDPEIPDQG
ncbi:polyketide cyclase [Marinobacter sp. R17]|uniref:SRPBCC family protein n=1 Tax=Marinobacter sp. R17 TaxID=2484250 RepID=UPI000F4D16BB|nr:SRPBCC family protein [Marinobacter sp. R17]ROT93694.1 polyketide cyclase [Marinobacter sp. R17]